MKQVAFANGKREASENSNDYEEAKERTEYVPSERGRRAGADRVALELHGVREPRAQLQAPLAVHDAELELAPLEQRAQHHSRRRHCTAQHKLRV